MLAEYTDSKLWNRANTNVSFTKQVSDYMVAR